MDTVPPDGTPAAPYGTGSSSPARKPRDSFVSISQIVGKADAKADVMTDSDKSSPTKRGAHRDSLTEELLDFHPEYHNNITIGNEGLEIDFNSLLIV